MLVYAADVNVLADNMDTIKKKIESLIDASKEVCLEVNARQNHDKKIFNSSFENVAQLRYFGMSITNQNLI
jgi:N12 class adenine-specific DNA methylase